MDFINGWTKEKVVEQLTKEFKGKCVDETTHDMNCLYRYQGKKCVAGCFIPDTVDFNQVMWQRGDGTNVLLNDVGIDTLMDSGDIPDNMPFGPNDMFEWQSIHDMLDRRDTIESQLKVLINFID